MRLYLDVLADKFNVNEKVKASEIEVENRQKGILICNFLHC